MRSRAGYSLVELLLVLAMIGILAQFAVPNYRAMILRARAVDLVSRIETVENAARNYQGDRFEWPPESGPGVVPAGLEDRYLPEGFSFTGDDYRLDWENVPVPGGVPGYAGTTRLLGVAVVTEREDLGRALVNVFGDVGWYRVGDSYVFVIER